MQSGSSGQGQLDVHMSVNHVGPFLLTQLLFPALRRVGGGGRVINVSSDSHYFARLDPRDLRRPRWGSWYACSKLANVMHARQLSRLFDDDPHGVVAVSLHPGLVQTSLFRQPTLSNVSDSLIWQSTCWDLTHIGPHSVAIDAFSLSLGYQRPLVSKTLNYSVVIMKLSQRDCLVTSSQDRFIMVRYLTFTDLRMMPCIPSG